MTVAFLIGVLCGGLGIFAGLILFFEKWGAWSLLFGFLIGQALTLSIILPLILLGVL